VLDDGFHVLARLAIADELDELVLRPLPVPPLPFRDGLLAGIVGRERLDAGALIPIEETAQ